MSIEKVNSIKTDMVGRLILIKGKVQGVFYRASAVESARRLGLKGAVKNLDNGDVAIEVFGAEDKVKELIEWTHVGSEFSKVEEVEVLEIPFKEMKDFKVVYD